MKTSAVVLCAALAGQALARPSPAEAQLERRFFLFDIFMSLFKGEDNSQLSPVPDDLPQEQLDFLKKNKQYVDAAAEVKGERKGTFSKDGLCFQEYPCYAVTNPKAAALGESDEINLKTASEMIENILKTDEIEMKYELKNSMLAGWSTKAGGFTFQTQGDAGKKLPSKVIAGLFANLVQIQFNVNPSEQKANTIRGSKVLGEGETAAQSLCVYPSDVDIARVQMFCIGVDIGELGDKEEVQAASASGGASASASASGALSSVSPSATATSLSSGTPQASATGTVQQPVERDLGSFLNGAFSIVTTGLCMFGSLLDDDTCKK